MAFATVEDLELRWHKLTDDEKARAEVLLGDAATMLSRAVCICAEDQEQADALRQVSCNMVQRVMSVTDDIYGVSKGTMTADIYSQSWTYDNPSGVMYITKSEKDMLGVSSAYLRTIRPKIRGRHAWH